MHLKKVFFVFIRDHCIFGCPNYSETFSMQNQESELLPLSSFLRSQSTHKKTM